MTLKRDYMVFNIPERDLSLEGLGLINQGLFPVDGELAKRYNALLKAVFNWDCDLESFRIGKRGLSPEVADYLKEKYPTSPLLEYGENYLNMRSANRFMVVLSPDQKSAPLCFPQTSFDDSLCDEVYRQARHTIEDVTQTEAMVGELEDGITVHRTAQDLLELRTIEVSLDTVNRTVKDYFVLKRMADELGEDDNALNSEYVARMQTLVERLGDIRPRAISKVFPITKEVHCFYVEFFKGVYCLRNFKNKEGTKTLLLTNGQPELRTNLDGDVLNYDIRNPITLTSLHGFKFLQFSESLLEQRMLEIEDETLLANGIDIVSLSPQGRKAQLIGISDKFPKSYDEMRTIKRKMQSSGSKFGDLIKDMGYETRLKLSEPASKPEIFNHLLAELDSTDIVRMFQFNLRKLRREFSKLPLNRQRYVAQVLLNAQLNQTGGKK
jgi:hypothetical protein